MKRSTTKIAAKSSPEKSILAAAPDKTADWVVTLNGWRLANQHRSQGRPIPEQKVGRNEPCPCGSGEKYKKCCGLN
jgi:uncharacterized protein